MSSSPSSLPSPPSSPPSYVIYLIVVLFCCCVLSPSSSGGGHPAHRISHCCRCCRCRCCGRLSSSSSSSSPLRDLFDFGVHVLVPHRVVSPQPTRLSTSRRLLIVDLIRCRQWCHRRHHGRCVGLSSAATAAEDDRVEVDNGVGAGQEGRQGQTDNTAAAVVKVRQYADKHDIGGGRRRG